MTPLDRFDNELLQVLKISNGDPRFLALAMQAQRQDTTIAKLDRALRDTRAVAAAKIEQRDVEIAAMERERRRLTAEVADLRKKAQHVRRLQKIVASMDKQCVALGNALHRENEWQRKYHAAAAELRKLRAGGQP